MQSKTRHWIYVVGGPDRLSEARTWQQRKVAQGKLYELIEAANVGADRLQTVGNDDVLYVYAAPGSPGLAPDELAAQLRVAGLDAAHRAVKLFISGSGDDPVGGGTSYAELVYRALRGNFPQAVVYGYRGEVHPEGYDGHKSAALAPGERPEGVPEAEWKARGLRAKENRVVFPAGAAPL